MSPLLLHQAVPTLARYSPEYIKLRIYTQPTPGKRVFAELPRCCPCSSTAWRTQRQSGEDGEAATGFLRVQGRKRGAEVKGTQDHCNKEKNVGSWKKKAWSVRKKQVKDLGKKDWQRIKKRQTIPPLLAQKWTELQATKANNCLCYRVEKNGNLKGKEHKEKITIR